MASDSADPRRRAVLALARVDARAAHAARLLGDAPPLVRELVLGTLRWQRVLDELLGRHLRQPMTALDPEVRAALRAGLYEAARLSTPVPVAVAEAVRVARTLVPRASGLVNAVLRRAAGEAWPDAGDTASPLSLRFSHPDWLVQRWLALLGEERTATALAADQEPAPLALLAGATATDELAAGGCVLAAHPYVTGVALVGGHAEVAVAALRRRRAYAMDPHAVLVARLLPDVGGPVLDMAAAPGGKSYVHALERPESWRVAADLQPGRAALLRRNLERLARPPAVLAVDGLQPALRPESCAAIVLDAPCSGTGTLRRHPEIRWRLRERDLGELTRLQRRLVDQAAQLLAPGGFLLYSTCSLEPEENAGVVAGRDLEAVPIAHRLPPGAPRLELPSGGVIIPPGPGGDGFTVHLLARA